MAQSDYFLKIDGIEGESGDHKHKGEIELESWSWGETNSGSSGHGGGAGSGKVSMQDFHFVMKINKASPKLLEACATGQHIKSCLFTARKAGGDQHEFLKIKFTDVLISSYQTGGSNGSTDIIEQISFNFSKIEQEYKEQKADGSLGGAIKAGYDVKANKKV
jgi:type VI secretion system secreted protein Hcp